MTYVVLQQVSSKYARSNASKTLDKPVSLKYLQRYIPPSKFAELQNHYPEESLYIWGVKLERHHQIPKMIPGQSLVLFRRGKLVFLAGVIKDLLVNPELAEYLWGHDETGESWGLVYLMQKVRNVSINSSEINELLGRKPSDNWQGMTSVEGEKAKAAINLVRVHLHAHQP